MTGKWQTIETACTDGVMEIALNRPNVLNAFNSAMRIDLLEAFEAAADDTDVRCVILSARGRAFCAGQDLGERKPLPNGERHDLGVALGNEYHPLLRRILSLPKPVIASVGGTAAGAGVSLALTADVCIAAEDAKFVLSFANIGLGPDCGASWFLPRMIGPQRAKGFAMSGRPITGAQADLWGMIWQSVPGEALASTTRDFAMRLAAQAPLSMAATKRCIDRSWCTNLSDQLEIERISQRKLGYSEDYGEGLAAFREKRAPRFAGR